MVSNPLFKLSEMRKFFFKFIKPLKFTRAGRTGKKTSRLKFYIMKLELLQLKSDEAV